VNILLVLLAILTLGAANVARQRYESAVGRGRRMKIPGGVTVNDVVRDFLDAEGASDVQIVEHTALVSDYCDPNRRKLYLNKSMINATDAGSLAIALHEAAHALQLGDTKAALNWRLSAVKVTRYGPAFMGLAAMFMTFFMRIPFRNSLALTVLVWFLIMLSNVMSLPVEFNASHRAMAWLERRLSKSREFVETMSALLQGVAVRDTAIFTRSPIYCFFGFLPLGGKLRPVNPPKKES